MCTLWGMGDQKKHHTGSTSTGEGQRDNQWEGSWAWIPSRGEAECLRSLEILFLKGETKDKPEEVSLVLTVEVLGAGGGLFQRSERY